MSLSTVRNTVASFDETFADKAKFTLKKNKQKKKKIVKNYENLLKIDKKIEKINKPNSGKKNKSKHFNK